jgi:hypothetical protein
MKKLPLFIGLVFIFSFVFASLTTKPALAAATTLAASADAEIKSDTPSSNFGASSVMDVGRLVPPQTSKKIRALVRFDLSSIPSNATIGSATFSIYLYGCGIYSQTIDDLNIGRNKGSWEESTVNWSNKPSFDTSTVLNKTAPCSSDDQYHNYSIKSFVEGWMAGTFPNYGIVLYGDEAPSESWIKFFSPKEDNTRPDPKLVINYTVPSSPGDGTGTTNGDTEDSDADSDDADPSKTGEDKITTTSASPSATIATPATTIADKVKGISGVKIALGIFLVLVLAGIAAYYFLIYRKKKKGAKKDKEPEKPSEKPSSEDRPEEKEETKPQEASNK